VVRYKASENFTELRQYQSVARLTAADFLQFNPASDLFGTGTPNFAGDSMEFGLTQIFGAGAAEVIIADYDNLNISINGGNGGGGPIPEPTSMALLLSGMIGLYATRRRT
jgi:hypothetical protein